MGTLARGGVPRQRPRWQARLASARQVPTAPLPWARGVVAEGEAVQVRDGVAAVAAQGALAGEEALLGPAGDGLGGDLQDGRHLGRPQEGCDPRRRPRRLLMHRDLTRCLGCPGAPPVQVSPKTLPRWAHKGPLPCQRPLGRHRRYPEPAIRELAASLRQEVHDQ